MSSTARAERPLTASRPHHPRRSARPGRPWSSIPSILVTSVPCEKHSATHLRGAAALPPRTDASVTGPTTARDRGWSRTRPITRATSSAVTERQPRHLLRHGADGADGGQQRAEPGQCGPARVLQPHHVGAGQVAGGHLQLIGGDPVGRPAWPPRRRSAAAPRAPARPGAGVDGQGAGVREDDVREPTA